MAGLSRSFGGRDRRGHPPFKFLFRCGHGEGGGAGLDSSRSRRVMERRKEADMLIAAHQPNFMPWLGYFDKMNKADLFVSVDHVQYERQSFQSRTRVKTGEGARWITVPVIQESRDERIADKRIDNSRDGRFRWGRKMFLTLKYSYQS